MQCQSVASANYPGDSRHKTREEGCQKAFPPPAAMRHRVNWCDVYHVYIKKHSIH